MLKKIYSDMGINPNLLDFEKKVEEIVSPEFIKVNKVMQYNQLKVLKAFQAVKVGEDDFNSKTGYGFSDIGREKLEKIYSLVFNTDDAIVRPTIVSGTHALNLSLTGTLFPGDKILSITGTPYDTLEEVIGIRGDYPGSLINIGVSYDSIDLTDKGNFDTDKILKYVRNKENNDLKMIYIQRSSGYSWRKAITIKEIKDIIEKVKVIKPSVIIMVDNCYGEFLDELEPTDVGVDLMAGSLIKNPGGGLASGGGYIVGNNHLINLVAQRMTSPGIGKEQGLMFNQTRSIMQGLFIAPKIVSEAIKGAIFCAYVYEYLGYNVNPKYNEKRSDIIQSIQLKNETAIISFCQSIQESAPIDSYVSLQPWDMPGYRSKVIMAAGAFIQGSSIELSADAPIREPYIAYFQGGLTYEHAKIGVLKSVSKLIEEGVIEWVEKM
jgi:cystathionine beta-lyase family protein involved in aluminum resistance